MKKIIIFVFCFFINFNFSNAFFGNANDLNLYSNIDSGIIKLEDNLITIELNGGEKAPGIINELNNLATINEIPACLDEAKTLSAQEFKNIIINNDIQKLSNYIDNKCINKNRGNNSNKDYSIQLLNDYLNLLRKHKASAEEIAKQKAKKIYQISNIGLYSDGILENSGFDLIVDIENIDKIIFASKTDYKGEDDVDIGGSIGKILNKIKKDLNNLPSYSINYDIYEDNNEDKVINQKPTNTYNVTNQKLINVKNNFICANNLNNNGLSESTNNFLINNIKNELNSNTKKEKDNPSTNKNNKDNNKGNKNNKESNKNNKNGKYIKVVDNSEWPCDKFFCINIDFIMYKHNLFGGGENITIEYLLNRANEHIKKFAASSLIPAKMTTNNFELGLKNLNLPDIFHMGFQISSKPIPILNIEHKSENNESEFAAKNMLEEFYKANGLDYKRKNDIILFQGIEQEKQISLNSEEMTNGFIIQKNIENSLYGKNRKKDLHIINKAKEKKVSYGIIQAFEEQYNELSTFSISINNYISNLQTIINNLNKKPIDKN